MLSILTTILKNGDMLEDTGAFLTKCGTIWASKLIVMDHNPLNKVGLNESVVTKWSRKLRWRMPANKCRKGDTG